MAADLSVWSPLLRASFFEELEREVREGGSGLSVQGLVEGARALVLTLLAEQIGGFQEANPIVARITHIWELLAAFKLLTLAFASAIFIKYRRERFTEWGCWGMCIVHVLLALLWLRYYAAFH